MQLRFFLFILTLILCCSEVPGQAVKVIKFDELAGMLNRQDDTLRVVNFWATWCAPCVKELPHFETVRQAYATKKLKVLLVSMDDKDVLNSKVRPFVRNRKIRSRVVLLDETDLNTWIDKIAPEWSGALPMTLIVNPKQKFRKFIDKSVKAGELESIINQYKL
jgi:thiol-disulfide isomerase/thioredoxin